MQASHLDRGSLQRGERAWEDRGRESSCGERPQEERVAALEGEAERLAGVGEPLLQCGGDGRATARRDDRVPAKLGDVDALSRWGAVEGEGGDHLFPAQSLGGEIVGDLACQQAEGGVELVRGEEAEHVGGDSPAQADLDAWVRSAEAGQEAGNVEVWIGALLPAGDAAIAWPASVDWATRSSSAARVKWWCRATASTALSCRSSISDGS
jgi:hypothetical protein